MAVGETFDPGCLASNSFEVMYSIGKDVLAVVMTLVIMSGESDWIPAR